MKLTSHGSSGCFLKQEVCHDGRELGVVNFVRKTRLAWPLTNSPTVQVSSMSIFDHLWSSGVRRALPMTGNTGTPGHPLTTREIAGLELELPRRETPPAKYTLRRG
jgi:hypothetical protein